METTQQFIARKNRESKEIIRWMKDIGRKGRWGNKIEARVFLPASNLKDHKVFVFERLKVVEKEGKFAYKSSPVQEYRIGYYIRGQIGRTKGRWVWGQYCPIIPAKDLNTLLKKARAAKVLQ